MKSEKCERMIKLVVFDLDGTLYDADAYFRPAFRTISQFLAPRLGDSPASIEKRLWAVRRKKGSMYKRLFNDVLSGYGIKDDLLVKRLVKFFHAAPIDGIRPYADALRAVKKLKETRHLGILTHGNRKKQDRKIRKLGLAKYFDFVVSAKDQGLGKSDPRIYRKLLARNYRADEIAYIGDNPKTDFAGCRKIGIRTVRLLRGEFAGTNAGRRLEADFRIRKFSELEHILKKLD